MRKRFLLMLLLLVLLAGCRYGESTPPGTTGSAMANTVSSSQPCETVPLAQPPQTDPVQIPSLAETEPDITTVPTEPETTEVPAQPPEPDDFVLVTDYIPDMVVDLKYATEDNFTGTVIYNFGDAYLRYGTVCKLMQVQQELRSMGLGLKLWDGFRPPQSQYRLWEICPDPVYVSDPNKGFSNHSRGDTVDITLVDSNGVELEMPTGFDDFSKLADRDYSDCSPEVAANAELLEQIMEKYGFTGYRGEWWHYTDDDDYSVEMNFLSD